MGRAAPGAHAAPRRLLRPPAERGSQSQRARARALLGTGAAEGRWVRQPPGGFSCRLERRWEVAEGLSGAVTRSAGRFGVLVLVLVEAYLVLPTLLVSAKQVGASREENFPLPWQVLGLV